MSWVFNYDGDNLAGWLWQEGDWSWGSVLTWHVTDLGYNWHVWSCYLWVWSWEHGWLYEKIDVEIMDVKPMDVAWNPWMEHCFVKFQ